MDSKLYMIEALKKEFQKVATIDVESPIPTYIDNFGIVAGLKQELVVNFATRLGIDYTKSRYKKLKDTSLRELVYYELMNYIQYYLPQATDLGLPLSKSLINMQKEEFKPLFSKLFKDIPFNDYYYNARMSVLTDYVMAPDKEK